MNNITEFLARWPGFTLSVSTADSGEWRVALRLGHLELAKEDADLDEAVDDLGRLCALHA